MKLKYIYFAIAVAGFILPNYFFIRFYLENGLNLTLFINQIFVNNVVNLFLSDLFVVGGAVIVFMFSEARRLKIKQIWLCVALMFMVGMSCGLPLFLYFREEKLYKNN